MTRNICISACFFFAPCLSLEPDRFAYEKARCQNAAKRRPQRTCKSPVPPLLALRGSRCHDRWKSPSKKKKTKISQWFSKRCPEEMAPTSWENISLTIKNKTRDWICAWNHENNRIDFSSVCRIVLGLCRYELYDNRSTGVDFLLHANLT